MDITIGRFTIVINKRWFEKEMSLDSIFNIVEDNYFWMIDLLFCKITFWKKGWYEKQLKDLKDGKYRKYENME